MYEELVGKKIRVVKSDDFTRYGILEEIADGNLKLRMADDKLAFVKIGTEKSVEECD